MHVTYGLVRTDEVWENRWQPVGAYYCCPECRYPQEERPFAKNELLEWLEEPQEPVIWYYRCPKCGYPDEQVKRDLGAGYLKVGRDMPFPERQAPERQAQGSASSESSDSSGTQTPPPQKKPYNVDEYPPLAPVQPLPTKGKTRWNKKDLFKNATKIVGAYKIMYKCPECTTEFQWGKDYLCPGCSEMCPDEPSSEPDDVEEEYPPLDPQQQPQPTKGEKRWNNKKGQFKNATKIVGSYKIVYTCPEDGIEFEWGEENSCPKCDRKCTDEDDATPKEQATPLPDPPEDPTGAVVYKPSPHWNQEILKPTKVPFKPWNAPTDTEASNPERKFVSTKSYNPQRRYPDPTTHARAQMARDNSSPPPRRYPEPSRNEEAEPEPSKPDGELKPLPLLPDATKDRQARISEQDKTYREAMQAYEEYQKRHGDYTKGFKSAESQPNQGNSPVPARPYCPSPGSLERKKFRDLQRAERLKEQNERLQAAQKQQQEKQAKKFKDWDRILQEAQVAPPTDPVGPAGYGPYVKPPQGQPANSDVPAMYSQRRLKRTESYPPYVDWDKKANRLSNEEDPDQAKPQSQSDPAPDHHDCNKPTGNWAAVHYCKCGKTRREWDKTFHPCPHCRK